MTHIKLDLMTDIDMLNMMERMKRGGLCFVGSQRYVKANNKYLPDYNPSVESNYVLYEYANNLYAYSMSENDHTQISNLKIMSIYVGYSKRLMIIIMVI
ncbi:MAG: hypothetical protein ACKPKO_48465, partial [Candidatus Fonsibacter sp.]